MYNSQNSLPRKNYGIRNTHKCNKCGKEFHFTKVPFLVICSGCKELLHSEDIIEIDYDN